MSKGQPAPAPPPPYNQQEPQVGYNPQPPAYPAARPPAPQPGYAPPPGHAVPNYGSAYQPVGQHMHTNNTTVVVGQPQAAPTVHLVQRKPENYIGLSIFTLLCCCWLFGLVALIFAMQVDSAYAGGDFVAAQTASRSARTWNIVGIVFGVVGAAISVIISVILIPIIVVADENSYVYNG